MSVLKIDKKRKKCLSVFTVLLAFLIVPLVLTFCTNLGYSWKNQKIYESWINPATYYPEAKVSQYSFEHSSHDIYYYDPNRNVKRVVKYSYGVHDWIADSALRMIRLDPLIPKKYTDWILNDNIPYGEFDDYDIIGRGYLRQRGWWSEMTKYGSLNNDANWMRNRRYARFLHGTGIPDWTNIYTINIKNSPIPFEACYHTAPWMQTHPYAHAFHFNSDGSIDFSHIFAGAYVIQAAQSAIHWFNWEPDEPIIYKGRELNPKGKWEAGAVCLGGMTHFIADVAHPFHTFHTNLPHGNWDKLGDVVVGWDDFTGFNGKGGPDWSMVNPMQYSVMLVPIDPWTAVKEMASFSHDYGGSHYAPSCPARPTDADLDSLSWVKVLLGKAVYYTACAMLWVFLQCDFPEDTFSDRWENGLPLGYPYKSFKTHSDVYHPPDIQTIRQSIDAVEGERAEWYDKTLSGTNLASLIYFAPLLAVTMIPLISTTIYYLLYETKELVVG